MLRAQIYLRCVCALLALLAVTRVCHATTITFGGSYDGSYDPYSMTPPSGQSTWSHGTATILPACNNDNGTTTAGVANFNDTSTSARVSVYRAFGSGTFSASQANDEYVYMTRIKLYSTGMSAGASPIFSLGMRDEYNGTTYGKTVMLGLFYSNTNPAAGTRMGMPGLYLMDATNDGNTGAGASIVLNTVNYFDDAWHTYAVKKFVDTDSITKVKVLVDDAQVGSTVLYSSLTNASSGTNGFGWFGTTQTTGKATVDYFAYGTSVVPEPGTIVLLTIGMIALIAYAWRKQK